LGNFDLWSFRNQKLQFAAISGFSWNSVVYVPENGLRWVLGSQLPSFKFGRSQAIHARRHHDPFRFNRISNLSWRNKNFTNKK
jgi:hypothetical protein